MNVNVERLKVVPFETVFALLAVISGAVGLLHVGTSSDALAALLPGWLTTTLNAMYLIAGIAMLVGLLFGRGDIEGFGLVQLGVAVLVRGVALGLVIGIGRDTATAFVFYGALLVACFVRMQTIARREVITKVTDADHGS